MRPRALMLAAALAWPAPATGQAWLVVVTGLPGTPRHAAQFDQVATALASAARTRLHLPDDRVIRLGASAPATAEAITRALADVAARAASGDVVTVVLIGHGSALSGTARLNLEGPDLSAAQLADALRGFADQEVVVVNAASASGPWIEALAGPRRTIITATRSATERDETVFARYLAEGLGSEAGDADRDGRVSVLEAFEYARRGVERHYQSLRRLRTEHALLDDDGDGRGSLAPNAAGAEREAVASGTGRDGRRAALLFLDAPPAPADDTVLAVLFARRDSLQRALASLRSASAADSAALERLLLELARTGRAIRDRQAGGRP